MCCIENIFLELNASWLEKIIYKILYLCVWCGVGRAECRKHLSSLHFEEQFILGDVKTGLVRAASQLSYHFNTFAAVLQQSTIKIFSPSPPLLPLPPPPSPPDLINDILENLCGSRGLFCRGHAMLT